MSFLFSRILVPFLNWGPCFFGLAVVLFIGSRQFGWKKIPQISIKFLIWTAVSFKIFYAALETLGQYYIWSGGVFTKLFLDQRAVDLSVLKEFSGKLFWLFNNKFGYFIFYSWGRFWIQIIISILVAGAFYLFLLFLKKYRERFFEIGETEIGFLLALVVGWPNFIVFLFTAFLSVILMAVIRNVFFKETYTTLGTPFLFAAFVSMFFGNYLINLFNLVAFRV